MKIEKVTYGHLESDSSNFSNRYVELSASLEEEEKYEDIFNELRFKVDELLAHSETQDKVVQQIESKNKHIETLNKEIDELYKKKYEIQNYVNTNRNLFDAMKSIKDLPVLEEEIPF